MTVTQLELSRLMITLAATWVNGNLTYVVNEILALPTAQAAILTSLLTDNFRARGLRSDSIVLRRLLGDRV